MSSGFQSVRLGSVAVGIFSAIGLLAVPCANAVTIYDEGLSGDLSNSGLTPTELTVSAGVNEIFGSTGRAVGGPVDRDYFTFTIPGGHELVAIAVLADSTVTLGSVSFFAVQGGTQVTVDPTAGSPAGLLGWTHYTSGNGNIIEDLDLPSGSTLGAGDYAFWIQETAEGTSTYGFAFQIEQAVPDAGPGWLASAGVLGTLLGFGRRRALSVK